MNVLWSTLRTKIGFLGGEQGKEINDSIGTDYKEFNSLQDKMKELKLSNDIKDFVVTKSEEEKIFVATFYGLIKSSDGGNNWEKIELIPKKKLP